MFFVIDLIQDLYLKELKSYKAPPVVSCTASPFLCMALTGCLLGDGNTQAKDAHVGVVKAFAAPATPSVPTLPDLAPEHAAYDTTEPTRATTTDAPTAQGEPAAGAEAYLAFLEADEAQEEAHH